MEFLHSHTSVVAQPDYNSPYYSGINPYALGFNMFMDIKRICTDPTDEDREWLPDIAGSDWLETAHFAMKNFKDESFISQFMSPKIIRDFKFFAVEDEDKDDRLTVTAIHNQQGYQAVREKLSAQYNLSNLEPNIQVYSVDSKGDRSLTLRYTPQNNIPLDNSYNEVLKHLHRLWGFTVKLESASDKGSVKTLGQCPETQPE
jgi:spore cortex formation protein SpoVR/YcgB (stage V sporulation)